MGWALTHGLQNLRAQVDARWPDRDRQTDGTIGNADHQDQTSGHNPDDTSGSLPAWNGDKDKNPEVRAWDMDHDIGDPDISAYDLVMWIIHLPNVASAIRYVIYKGIMYHERDGFAPSDSSGHETHIHFEGAWTDAGDESTFDFRLDELGDDSMSQIEEYFASVARAVRGDANATSVDRARRNDLAAGHRFGDGLNYVDQDGAHMMPGRFDHVDARLNQLEAKIDALAAPVTPDVDEEALAAALATKLDLSAEDIQNALREVLRNGVGQ